MSWRLEGYDTFARDSYPLEGTYADEASARETARERLKKLESTTGQTGGPCPTESKTA